LLFAVILSEAKDPPYLLLPLPLLLFLPLPLPFYLSSRP